MLGNHRTAISHTCDTEALEDALEGACGGNLQVTYRLELRGLATSLWYDAAMKKQRTAGSAEKDSRRPQCGATTCTPPSP